jgi:hypothetical protein
MVYVPTPLFNQPNYIPHNFDFLNHPAYQQVYQKRRNFDQYDNFSNSDVLITPVNNQSVNSINQNLKETIPFDHQNF